MKFCRWFPILEFYTANKDKTAEDVWVAFVLFIKLYWNTEIVVTFEQPWRPGNVRNVWIRILLWILLNHVSDRVGFGNATSLCFASSKVTKPQHYPELYCKGDDYRQQVNQWNLYRQQASNLVYSTLLIYSTLTVTTTETVVFSQVCPFYQTSFSTSCIFITGNFGSVPGMLTHWRNGGWTGGGVGGQRSGFMAVFKKRDVGAVATKHVIWTRRMLWIVVDGRSW